MRITAGFVTLFFCSVLQCRKWTLAVAFNLNGVQLRGFPFVDDNFRVATGVVMADFNRDEIPDVAYTFPVVTNLALAPV